MWIPRTATGYVEITCPDCLRSFSVRTRDVRPGVVLASPCIHCGAEISYRLDGTISRAGETTALERSHTCLENGQRAVAESKKAITRSKVRFAKTTE